MKEFLIIGNGQFLAKPQIQAWISNKIVIALDGAVDRLMAMDIHPNIILGDLDSCSESAKHFWQIKPLTQEDGPVIYPGKNVTIVQHLDQQYTDLMKAILYCDANKAEKITIICALGDRLDHQEANLRCLRRFYNRNRPIVLYHHHARIQFLKDQTITLHGTIGDKCALFAYPEAIATTQGLLYELEHYKLIFGFKDSVANSFNNATVTMSVQGEALVMQFHE